MIHDDRNCQDDNPVIWNAYIRVPCFFEAPSDEKTLVRSRPQCVLKTDAEINNFHGFHINPIELGSTVPYMASTTTKSNFQTSPIHHPPIPPTVPTRACPCQFEALPIVRKFKGLLSKKLKNHRKCGILCRDLPLESKNHIKQIQVLDSAFKDPERTIKCWKLWSLRFARCQPLQSHEQPRVSYFFHDGAQSDHSQLVSEFYSQEILWL